MAKKRKLSDLVREETQPPTELTELQTSELTDLQTSELTDLQTSELTDLQTSELTDLQTSELTELQTTEVPKYLTLIRKETRLREDQIDRLTAIARKLNRSKRGGERITENTLIRVAVDLLLNGADSLSGADEAELRDSLGLDRIE